MKMDNYNEMHSLESEHRLVNICTVIVLLNALLNSVLRANGIVDGKHFIISLVYIGVLFQWMFSIRRRFIQSDIRNNLTVAAILMIFWISERYIKYAFISVHSVINRYMWYMYYIPFVMVPVLMFMSVLYIGKTDEDKIDRRWNLCYIPAVIVSAGILTNDLHQLAFRFNPRMVDWEVDYSRGFLYICALLILIFSITGMIITVIINGADKKNYRVLWLTGIIVLLGIIYIKGYSSTTHSIQKIYIQKMFEFPEFTCFFLVAFFESLVYYHLLPSNSGHESFFMESSLHAGLADSDYNVKLKGKEWVTPTPSMIQRAEEWPIYIAENSKLLKCIPVSGGHFYWMEDVAELIRLNEKLAETGDYLEEERLMLDETVRLSENRKSFEEQNRLYDMMAKRLQPQLNNMSELLDNLSENEDEFRNQMRYIGILGAYIKRRSNILLLSGTDSRIDSNELNVSINELLSYVSMNEVTCLADIVPDVPLEAGYVLFIFELLENVIEAAMPNMSALMTALRVENGELVFYIEAATPTEVISDNGFDYENGVLDINIEDDCEFITFRYRMSGGDEI